MDDGELGAVLCALAGTRAGDAVGAVGAPPLAVRALLAASGRPALTGAGARVVVTAGGAAQAAEGARALAPGGRLVGTAQDRSSAAVTAASLGLSLRHVEALAAGVAWAAVSAPSP